MIAKNVWQRAAHQAVTAKLGTPAPRKVSQVKQAKNKAGGKQKGLGGGSDSGKSVSDIVRKDGKEYFNGVDITDKSRTFSFKEFRKIKPIFKDYLEPHRTPRQTNVSAVTKEKASNGNKFGTNQYE